MQLYKLIGACAAISACVAMHAQAAPSARMHDARMGSSAACDAAKRSAWFERQRQLTDGDVDPAKALPAPRECMDVTAQSKEAQQQDSALPAGDRKTAEARKDGRVY